MAVVKRKGRKNQYKAEIYIKGLMIKSKSFATAAEAHAWHDTYKDSFESGHLKNTVSSSRDITFGECIESYLKDQEGFLRLRKSSQQSMQARMAHFTESPIVSEKMSDFSDRSIDEWLDWILEQPTAKNPGRKSFRIELKYLTSMLNWYREFRDARFSVPITKKHRKRSKFKPVKPRRKDYFIRAHDVRPWVEWLKVHRNDLVYHRLARFQTQAGTRIGETCGLCWSSVDLNVGEAYVERTMCWDHWTRRPYLEETAKTDDSYGVIQLTTDLIAMLKEMKAEAEAKDEVVFDGGSGVRVSSKNLVFVNSKGMPLRYNGIVSAYNAGFEALSLPWTATHICRHTQGTLGLVANNGNISKVQATLRQADRKTTEGYAKAVACLDRSTVMNVSKLMGFEVEEEVRKAAD